MTCLWCGKPITDASGIYCVTLGVSYHGGGSPCHRAVQERLAQAVAEIRAEREAANQAAEPQLSLEMAA